MKKFLLAALSLVVVAALAITGTIAWLTWEESDVNVMTVGNVKIEQQEWQRKEGGSHINPGAVEGDLVLFEQKQSIYPAVPKNGLATDYSAEQDDLFYWGVYSPGGNGLWNDAKLANVMDKIVMVKNVGKSDAYYRTFIAIECPEGMTVGEAGQGAEIMINVNGNERFDWTGAEYVTIAGERYALFCATYNQILTPGEVSRPSLLQVVLTHHATNEDMEKLGGSMNVLAFSQAVQVEGFDSAQQALEAAFGTDHPFGGDYKPEVKGWVYDEEDFAAAVAAGEKKITLGASIALSTQYDLPADTEIDGAGYTIGRTGEDATARTTAYVGTMLKVAANATLTLTDVTIDGGAVWTGAVDPTLQRGTANNGVVATGVLVDAASNAKIVLGEGAVLQNNDGALAVNLGTRIGATLIIDGGQIINNQSGSGAIWGGGHITIYDGKISGNSSTGIAGAIRMVSNCNLTMDGGEISHNKAATDGGAIWGYGSSTYTFNGGEMAYNEAGGTGGGIYTGNYSVINIGGNFELHNNNAANTGAIRLTDHTSMTMTGGKVYNNTQNGNSNAFNTWNNSISITGGEIADDFSFVGGLGLTIGAADIDGVISYNLSTNHNTAYLKKDFGTFAFKVDETDEHFGNFNFKPEAGYVYTEGDEAKLICMNDGYSTYWDAATSTFKLKAE